MVDKSRSVSMRVSRDGFIRVGASTLVALTGLEAPAYAGSVSTAPATVAVFPSTNGGAVPAGVAGLSYEKSKLLADFFTTSNVELIGLMRRLGTSTLRIGGNSADKMTWAPQGTGSTRGQIAPSDLQGVNAFLQATGWKLIYGINLAANTPELAAAEAAFASHLFGDRLASFEIGNECDAYARNGLRSGTYTVADFISEWSTYATTIRQRVPSAPLSGPASGYRLDDWTIPFAAREGSSINCLTQHYYQGNGKDPKYSMSKLLASHDFFPKILKKLQTAASSNGIAGGFRLSETNSLYDGGAQDVSNAHGSALWMIDFLMTSSQFGSSGANIHGGGDGTYNPYYTPIADTHSKVSEVRPAFYGMLFVSRISPGSMHTVNVSSSLNVSAYYVAGHDGLQYLAIINKDDTSIANVTVDLPGPASAATELILSGPSLTARTGTRLGGSVIGNDGSWSPQQNRVIPINGAGSFTVDLKPGIAKLLTITP